MSKENKDLKKALFFALSALVAMGLMTASEIRKELKEKTDKK